LRLVLAIGMKAPSFSRPLVATVDPLGAASEMYFSPSRLVCCTSATASEGSTMSLRIVIVTRACQPTRLTESTCPTGTSLAITRVRGTTSTTSAKSAVT